MSSPLQLVPNDPSNAPVSTSTVQSSSNTTKWSFPTDFTCAQEQYNLFSASAPHASLSSVEVLTNTSHCLTLADLIWWWTERIPSAYMTISHCLDPVSSIYRFFLCLVPNSQLVHSTMGGIMTGGGGNENRWWKRERENKSKESCEKKQRKRHSLCCCNTENSTHHYSFSTYEEVEVMQITEKPLSSTTPHLNSLAVFRFFPLPSLTISRVTIFVIFFWCFFFLFLNSSHGFVFVHNIG